MKRKNINYWLLLPVLALIMGACKESNDNEDTTKPNIPVNPGDWQAVPVSGGTIEKGDIAITFPSGTFTTDTEVAVTEAKKGEVLGDDEVSTFYQITMPPQINKPLTISIKCDEAEPGTNVVAHAPCYSLSEDILGYDNILLEADYSNGTYTFTLPATQNGNDYTDEEKLSVSFGVAKMEYCGKNGPSKARTTRAPVFDDTFTEGNVSWHFNFGWFQKYRLGEKLVLNWDDINDCIRDAIKILHGLGLEVTKRDVTFSFADIDEYGRFNQSGVCNEWSSIQVGTHVLNDYKNSRADFRSTIIHELMHMYQADYDPRSAFRKADKIGTITEKIGQYTTDKYTIHDGSERLMLYESGAVWAEQFMIGKFNDEFALKYITGFIKGFYDIDEIYANALLEVNTHKRYESHGYGMSVLLQYITRKMTEYNLNDKSIVKLYKIWHDNNYWTKDCLKKLTKEAGRDIFNLDYDEFLLSLLKGELVDGMNVAQMDYIASGQVNDQNLTREASGNCFVHGCQINQFTVSISDDIDMEKKQLVIDQKEPKAKTYVIIPKTEDNKKVFKQYDYAAFEDSPITIDGAELKKDFHMSERKATTLTLFTVTTNYFNSKTEPYKVEVSLKDANVSIDKIDISATYAYKVNNRDEVEYEDVFGVYMPLHARVDNVTVTKQGGDKVYVSGTYSGTFHDRDFGQQENTVSFYIENASQDYSKWIITDLKADMHKYYSYTDSSGAWYDEKINFAGSNIPYSRQGNVGYYDYDLEFFGTAADGVSNLSYHQEEKGQQSSSVSISNTVKSVDYERNGITVLIKFR